MTVTKPTKEQLVWQDMEIGVLIHYCMEIYRPELEGNWFKTKAVRKEIEPATINPPKLEPEQWVRSAVAAGAKYAILVANHGTGFSLWNTKVNDFSIASTPWRGGGGDICREFVDACKKYGIRPGFYYHTGANGYYGIDNEQKYDFFSAEYQEYVRKVEAQLEELWSEYGELFEIWFDGGILPTEQGGPDLLPILEKYQPNAICFQGPKNHLHNVRWGGNEDGCVSENCWATTNACEAYYDGSEPQEDAGIGDPDGKYYWPVEADIPNRTKESFGGGWAWRKGEEHYCFTPEQLLDRYIRSVGRNCNLLLGMAISVDGDFQDEEQFEAFGKLLKDTFGNPIAIEEQPEVSADCCTVSLPEKQDVHYVVIREDVTDGQLIRGFKVLADGVLVYEGECIGHKRIIPIDGVKAKEITLEITKKVGNVKIRDVAVY